MLSEQEILIDLLEKRQLLLSEVAKANRAINSYTGYDQVIDDWANKQMTKIDAYVKDDSIKNRITFALERLRMATVQDITDYLVVLGESKEKKGLSRTVKKNIDEMYLDGLVNSSIRNELTIFSLNQSHQTP